MKRHPLDPFSLLAGVILLSIGGAFLFTRVNIARFHMRWAWPIPLIAIGGLIVALAYRGERQREERSSE